MALPRADQQRGRPDYQYPAASTPGVAHVIGVSGFSIVTSAQELSGALVIAILTPWADRGPSESAEALMAKLKPVFNASPPPISPRSIRPQFQA